MKRIRNTVIGVLCLSFVFGIAICSITTNTASAVDFSKRQDFGTADSVFANNETIYIRLNLNDYPQLPNLSPLSFDLLVNALLGGNTITVGTQSLEVTAAKTEVSFKDDILPLFEGTPNDFTGGAGYGAWFNYGGSGASWGGPDISCGACHNEDLNGDGEEQCPPECHVMDINSHAGWLNGADESTAPILGESSVGDTDYNWSSSKLRARLRNNRMPPGIPFHIDELNRDGGDVDFTNDGDDLSLGGQFYVNTTGGEVDYGSDDNAVGLLAAYTAGLAGTPTSYMGSANPVTWDDIKGLFNRANVWFNGGLACTDCHGCSDEPPCYHGMDLNSEAGLKLGADDHTAPLMGESSVGATDYNWGRSKMRGRLRNNRMPPNAPFDLEELTRKGPMIPHPVTGAPVRAVDLIGEWVDNGAPDN